MRLDDVTVFVITSGEPSTAECLARLNKQDDTFEIVVIKDVRPMHVAFQKMIDEARTSYYVEVDADMLLEPWAIGRLREKIAATPEDVAVYIGWLWGDAEEQPIQGVKIYRHDVMVRFPYHDSLSCEVEQVERMKEAGYRTLAEDASRLTREDCYGLHFSLQTPEIAFRRSKRLVQKLRKREWMDWVAPHPERLMKRWLADPEDEVKRAAFFGALAGFVGDVSETEMDARDADQDYRRIAAFLGEYRHGPKELVLYITDRCNFRCVFGGNPCMREAAPDLGAGAGVPHHGDISFALVERALDRWPSIRAICVAGFGEPLLYPDLKWMISRFADRGLFVGLITNGSLLAQRLPEIEDEMQKCSGHYVSVSLNAATREEHEEMSRTKTWDRVLEGVRAASARMNVGLSFVVTRRNATLIGEYLKVANGLGAKFVDLHNVLPHAGSGNLLFRDTVITTQSADALREIERAKSLPGADLVRSWPKPIDLDSNPHRCMSPFVSLGLDAQGFVSACRRVEPPKSAHGHVDRPEMWRHDEHYTRYRLSIVGDRLPPDACRACFGNWHE